MKIERAGNARTTRRAGAYGRRAENLAPAPAVVAVPDGVGVFGIPEAEFTPRVRDAVMALMGEVDALKRELDHTRARLDEMERVADRDHLLPILNRRAFVRELTRHISLAVRYATPASLIYFDLDGFKAINDTHGHACGDAMLEHFAEVLLAHVRDSDTVGRLGGDEFGIILSHATHAQAQTKVQSLAERLRRDPARWQGRDISLGFSFGAFELSASDSADIAIARADQAMYAHKRKAALTR